MEKKEKFELRLKCAEKYVHDLLMDDEFCEYSSIGAYLRVASFSLSMAVFGLGQAVELNTDYYAGNKD